MKFKVREGFVVNIRTVSTVGERTTVRENSFYEGDELDVDQAIADEHLHKLEPVDKTAKAYVESKHPQPAAAVAGVAVPQAIDYVALARAIVFAQAEAAAGVAASSETDSAAGN